MARTPHFVLEDTRLCSVWLMMLIDYRRVTIVAVVHVNDIFAVGLKSRCDRSRDELNHLGTVKNLGGLLWRFGGCHYSWGWEKQYFDEI